MITLSLVLGLSLFGGSVLVYRRWIKHELEQQAREKREELERVMALTHDLSKRGPRGFALQDRKRVS